MESDIEDLDQTEASGAESDVSNCSSHEGNGSDASSHGGTPEDIEMEINFVPGVGQHLDFQEKGAQELEGTPWQTYDSSSYQKGPHQQNCSF